MELNETHADPDFYFALLATTTCAALCRESRMYTIKATDRDRKSGGHPLACTLNLIALCPYTTWHNRWLRKKQCWVRLES